MSLPKLFAVALLSASVAFSQSPDGTITGIVLDAQTGRAIAGAEVAINGQTGGLNKTDSEGRFTIAVPEGSYTLGFSAENYHDVRLTDVAVSPGEITEASTVMANLSVVTSIDVVESATAVGATAQAMLIEQKLAPVVSDSLSHEELAASTSSDAAGALEKVTGVSVVGERYVYVRGLGERYSAAQMNGALMTTTEPEKRVVPLDLFPAALIENLRILKTYSPDLPAEFSGGLVQMQTIAKPALLRHLFALAAHYPAQILSYNKMLGQLQDAGNTVTLAAYLRLLETAFLASGLELYSRAQIRKRGSSPKLILWNNALVNAPSLKSYAEAFADGAWWGRLVENAVGAHLLNHLQGPQWSLGYWRDAGEEVDFVVSHGAHTSAIEVKSGRSGKTSGMGAFRRRYPKAKLWLVGETGIPLAEFFSRPAAEWFS